MIPIIQSKALLSAVLAGLPAVMLLGWSSTAHGQYQVGSNGHLLDANNRIGSGGYNGNGTPHGEYNNINQNIVTGNVSGLNYFHGNRTDEFDPNTFDGPTGSSSFSQFNAAATPTNYQRRDNGQPNYTPYYNNGNTVGNLPNNYVAQPGNTGFVPAPTVSPLTPTAYDARLELTNVDPTRGNLATPGEGDVTGPVDPSAQNQSMYSMSPLYGVRPNSADAANGSASPRGQEDTFFNSRTTDIRSKDPSNRPTADPAAIQRMRDELNTTIQNDQSSKANVTAPPVAGAIDVSQSQKLGTIPTPTDQVSNQSLTSNINNAPLNNGLDSGQGVQNQLLLPPGKQSKQIEELEKRYNAQNNGKKPSDVDAAKLYNDQVRLSKNTPDTSGKNPGKSVLGTDLTPGPTAPGASHTDKNIVTPVPMAKPILTQQPPSAQDAQPYIVTSLATGIRAKGLSQLMKTAEDQMRQGKFTEAVDTYQTAEQVAPNNPFVSLGHGFAELGASYYGKADQDISRAINADPAVLVGRYDLNGFLGQDRVAFVQKDLADIADHEKGAQPLVLLAYIAHNTGDDATTAKDLTEATQRGGYADLIRMMKMAWSIK